MNSISKKQWQCFKLNRKPGYTDCMNKVTKDQNYTCSLKHNTNFKEKLYHHFNNFVRLDAVSINITRLKPDQTLDQDLVNKKPRLEL